MTIHHEIRIYDSKTGLSEPVLSIPEKVVLGKLKKRGDVERVVKAVMGEEWWSQNWFKIMVVPRIV